jgi:hypothetical protein
MVPNVSPEQNRQENEPASKQANHPASVKKKSPFQFTWNEQLSWAGQEDQPASTPCKHHLLDSRTVERPF